MRGTLPLAIYLAVALTVDARMVWLRLGAGEPWFGDAVLYHYAAAAWLAGRDPWSVAGPGGLVFAGLPPTLLLGLVTQPLGVPGAQAFWALAGLAGTIVAKRLLNLPVWWLAFPPFWEAWLAGSPDAALVGLMAAGGGSVAALTKPYSVPAMLADGRWRAVAIGGALLMLTAPILPWGMFIAEWRSAVGTLDVQSHASSAWWFPPLLLIDAAALALLGWRRAVAMAVPVLGPSTQPHYANYGVRVLRDSPWLALALSVPGGVPLLLPAIAWIERKPSMRSRGLRSEAGSEDRQTQPVTELP